MPPLRHFVVCFLTLSIWASSSFSGGHSQVCSSDGDCQTGLYCFSCEASPSTCVRKIASNPFQLVNNSLPFNKYAFLTTHNSFAIDGEQHKTGPRITFTNQEDTITMQLSNGVRAFMLDTYDFKDDVWLCHSFEGSCYDITAFEPAVDTLKEIEKFLAVNPTEIVTLILEDYVKTPMGLTKVLSSSGLSPYLFPVSKMPANGEAWPLVSEMVANNQRLVVFTSVKSKQESEGIAYQWNFMVEAQYGNDGEEEGKCTNREESSAMSDTSKSLILVNYFKTIPAKQLSCSDNSASKLITKLNTCLAAAGNRWPNFIAVDYYKRSNGGGVFEALDKLNGQLLCGSDDVHSCTTKH